MSSIYALTSSPVLSTYKPSVPTGIQSLEQRSSSLTPPVRFVMSNQGTAYLQQAPSKQLSHFSLQLPLAPEDNSAKLLLSDLLLNGSPQTKAMLDSFRRQGMEIDVMPLDENLQLNILAPKGLEAQMVQAAFQIVSQPNLDEKYYSNLKTTMLSNLEKLSALPEVSLSETINKTLYGQNHPYAKTVQSAIAEINAQSPYSTLALYRNTVSDPSRIRISWVSPMPIAQQQAILESTIQQFGWFKNPYYAQPLKETPAIVPQYFNTLVYKLLPNDRLNRAHITYAWHAPKPDSPDYLAFRVLEKILGGMSGDFFQVLRNQQGLVYSTRRQYTMHRKGSEFTVTTQVNLDKVLQGLRGINHVQRILANGETLSPTALFRAKKTLQLELREAYQSAEGANFEMTQRLENGLPPRHPNELINQLQQISVEDIKQVAQKVFGRPAIVGITAPTDTIIGIKPYLSNPNGLSNNS